MSKKQKLVSGPAFCFRIEGEIEEINKVAYIFGDYHQPEDRQYQCPSWKSDEFVRYFAKTMSKTNKSTMYDLFFETGKTSWNDFQLDRKNRYIDEVNKYFKSTLNIIEENPEEKRVNKGSTEQANLRLHHVDPRELFREHNGSYAHYYDLEDHMNVIKRNFWMSHHQLEKIKDTIFIIIAATYEETFLLLHNKSEPDYEKKLADVKANIGEANFEKIKKLMKKLLNDYSSEYVKNLLLNKSGIIKSIETYLNKLIKHGQNLINSLEKFNEYCSSWGKLKPVDDKCIYGCIFSEIVINALPVIKNGELFESAYTNLYSTLMDINTLRRFLDKKYISKTIMYTGAWHSADYLFILVKYFDFKITHSSNKDKTSLEFENIIKKCENLEEVLCKCSTETFGQCSDMTDFPENFE